MCILNAFFNRMREIQQVVYQEQVKQESLTHWPIYYIKEMNT